MASQSRYAVPRGLPPIRSPEKQTVLWLQRHQNLYTHGFRRGDDELQLPACEIRQADVLNLPGVHRVIEKRQHFLDCAYACQRRGADRDLLFQCPGVLREAFKERWSQRRIRPAEFTSWLALKRPFVASKTWSVTSLGRAANQGPMTSSETPFTYTFAVSTRLD